MNVYVAMRGDHRSPLEILGIFSTKQSASNCCLSQPTLTRLPWRRTDGDEERWHNGHGLYVKVISYEVQ